MSTISEKDDEQARSQISSRVVRNCIDVELYRPDPPKALREPEAKVWREIVSSLPGGWFNRANEPLLAAYCRHIVTADRLDTLINETEDRDPETLKAWDKLLMMRERETKAATSLARSMRFTQQAQMHPRTAARAAIKSSASKLWERKPWEDC